MDAEINGGSKIAKWVGAAGCCINDDGNLLMIKGKDDDKWSVPSGGQEPNESIEECCMREVWEETGYKVVVIRSLGIISNGDHNQQIDKLKTLGIARYFSHVITSGNLGVAKPNPEIFKEACRRSGESNCFYVGDRLDVDAVASQQAGMTGIWLNRERNLTNGELHNGIITIECLTDLIKFVLKK